MISFRAKPEQSIDWTSIGIDGDDEDVASHAFMKLLAEAGWEILISGEREYLYFDDLDEL